MNSCRRSARRTVTARVPRCHTATLLRVTLAVSTRERSDLASDFRHSGRSLIVPQHVKAELRWHSKLPLATKAKRPSRELFRSPLGPSNQPTTFWLRCSARVGVSGGGRRLAAQRAVDLRGDGFEAGR